MKSVLSKLTSYGIAKNKSYLQRARGGPDGMKRLIHVVI